MITNTVFVNRPAPSRWDSLKSPVQVCLLPLMDAAVQFSLMSASTVVATKKRPPIVTLDVNGTTDGRPVTASYQLDMVNRTRPFTGTGQFGGRSAETSSVLRGEEGRLSERVGRIPGSIDFQFHGRQVMVAGRIGRVPVSLSFEQAADGGRLQGFTAHGTLGDDAFSLDARLFGLERKNVEGRPSHLEGELHVRGLVGDLPIIKLYQLASMGLPNGEELSFHGEGRVGDHYQVLAVTLCIISEP